MAERVVLVHSGICDARMWDGLELPDAERHELRGFGQTPLPPAGEFSHADDLIERLGGAPGALVGASFGGWVCLHVAAQRPELVTDLALLDAPLFDHDWSDEVLDHWQEEDRLLEQGDLRGAAMLSADFWLADLQPRERVVEMQERAYQLDLESEAEPVDPESIDLSAIAARALVAVGALDRPDIHAIAERLAREIPGARHELVDGAGHLPALERPRETEALLRDFLRI